LRALILLDTVPTITLYDLTNTYLEGTGTGILQAAADIPEKNEIPC